MKDIKNLKLFCVEQKGEISDVEKKWKGNYGKFERQER